MLPNGLAVWHIPTRSLPVVQIRLVVRAGSNLDRDRPGLAHMTAVAIANSTEAKPGGPRPETLIPEVQVRPGTTTFGLDLPNDQLEAGVDRLGAVARQPKLDNAPLAELRASEHKRAADLIRDDPAGIARAIATRDLLGLSPPPTALDWSKITVADLKALHKAAYAPKNLGLVLVGDVSFDEAVQAAKRAFGSWDSAVAAMQPPTIPAPVQYTRVIVADRPASHDAIIVLATPGPSATDAIWPALWLAGRSVAEPRDQHARCLARDSATFLSLDTGAGPAPMIVCLAVDSDRTVERVGSGIDRMRRIAAESLSNTDLEAGRSAFDETLATRLSSSRALADLAAAAMGAGLEHDQLGRQIAQVQATTTDQIRDAVRKRARDGMLVVVVGDASRLGDPLSRFGDVTVIDPADGFAKKRQIPASPAAPSSRP